MPLPRLAAAFASLFVALYYKEYQEYEAKDPGAWDVNTINGMLVVFVLFILTLTFPANSLFPSDQDLAALEDKMSGKKSGGSNKPVLAVDLDEVCCAYVQAFIKYSNSTHGTSLAVDDFTSYMFWEVPGTKLGSREEAQDRVYAFHASRYFTQIEPIPGAKFALDILKNTFDLHVVTSRQTDIEPQTRAFVKEYFPGVFTELHFGNHFGKPKKNWFGQSVVNRVSKPEMCKRIGAVALIDDSLDYAKQCASSGIPVFLFGDYAWNRSTTVTLDARITRVPNWRMIAQLVSKQVIEEATGEPLKKPSYD